MKVTWLALEWPCAGQHSGGVGRYLQRLAERMVGLVELTAVVFEGAVAMDGVKLVTLPAPSGRLGRYYGSAWRARAAVSGTRPDLIHAHGDDFLVRKSAVPLVRSFYGSSWNEAKSSSGIRRANHVVLAGAEKIAHRRAEVRLGIAPESVDLFQCQHVFPPYLRSQQALPLRKPADVPLVVFMGSFDGRKQGHVVQRSVAAGRSQGREIRLAVIGPAADAGSWEPWVEHFSGLDDYQVSDLLSQAWVLATPSIYEGFGIPVLEALDHAVPVVAYPNPGSEYLAGLAQPGTPLTLARLHQFERAILSRLDLGPFLDESESAASAQLVNDIAELGSPKRLLSIYSDVVGRQTGGVVQ